MIKNSKLVLPILILSPIFLNFFTNIFSAGFTQYFYKVNILDIFFTTFLFFFLYEIGKLIKKSFNLNSICVSVIFYLYSFLTAEILLMVIFTSIKSSEVFLIVNLLWIIIFIYKSLIKYIFSPVLIILSLNICFKYSKVTCKIHRTNKAFIYR